MTTRKLRLPSRFGVPVPPRYSAKSSISDTKPSCGVGLLWYVARGEWRRLGIALGTTAALAGLAFVIAPDLWPKWITYVLDTGVSPNVGTAAWIAVPLLIRLAAAILLVLWGARTNRAWTVPIASMLALPPETVKKQSSRSLTRLRNLLQDERVSLFADQD